MNLEEMLDHEVTLHGIAMDAQAGAVLQLDDGTPVYVGDVAAWDDEFVGQELTVTGVLVRQQLAPEPRRNERGGHSHGMLGGSYVVREPIWRLR